MMTTVPLQFVDEDSDVDKNVKCINFITEKVTFIESYDVHSILINNAGENKLI